LKIHAEKVRAAGERINAAAKKSVVLAAVVDQL